MEGVLLGVDIVFQIVKISMELRNCLNSSFAHSAAYVYSFTIAPCMTV